ncbi:EamA family transporter [Nonomuraea sp. NPDC050153]|uniref:EamA family transporter n=1 Tax=Nonomuraea sp. NPDC050153 TaxID=3364359 RepID=UPI003796D7B8
MLYYRGIRDVGPASASIMMFLVPVVGTTCSALFLGESFGTVQAVGAAVLLVGAVLAVTQGRLPVRQRAVVGEPAAPRRS